MCRVNHVVNELTKLTAKFSGKLIVLIYVGQDSKV